MYPLILDQYARQSLLKRFLGNALTGLGWAFWIYLWLPLLAAILLLLGAHPEQATSAASHSILALLATLAGHVSMVVIMIAAFFTWSLLQWLGKRHRQKALQEQHVNAACPAAPATRVAQDLPRWQQAQCMVVSHDDASGFIQQIEILKPKNPAACREYPPVSLRFVQRIPKSQFDPVPKRFTDKLP